ncbi:MAG: nuclear transport factor 2 family protein [Deltaproteobacteria bacterium]|nr:nuclear transport factor 2 family protein [Deltaproteobacteria bacterium]
MRRMIYAWAVAIAAAGPGCATAPTVRPSEGERMRQDQDLREVIRGWFAAAAQGDVSWRDRHVSQQAEIRIIGTDPEEFLTGSVAYEFLANEAKAAGGKIRVSVGHVEAYVEGDVGWGVALPTITLPDGKTASPRWSAVFHRENGAWKLIQLHASIPVTNAAAFGDTFAGAPPGATR